MTPGPAGVEEGTAAPLSRVLEQVDEPHVDEAPRLPDGSLRTARVVAVRGRAAEIVWRGRCEVFTAMLAPEVERSIVEDALENSDLVMVETGDPPMLVGVLKTRSPRVLKLKAGTVEIEGDSEVLVRSGRAALRLREDGDVEIVGGRIHAASRGLFRLVGRILRLN